MTPSLFRLSIFALALVACAPLSTYYKPGASVDRLNSDTTSCRVAALRNAPVANQVRTTAPRYIPPRQTCDSSGNCTSIAGYWLPGQTYTVDVNAALRGDVEQQCMAKKGYVPAQIPSCPDHVARQVDGKTNVLPQLTDKSCAVRNDDGSFLIVERG